MVKILPTPTAPPKTASIVAAMTILPAGLLQKERELGWASSTDSEGDGVGVSAAAVSGGIGAAHLSQNFAPSRFSCPFGHTTMGSHLEGSPGILAGEEGPSYRLVRRLSLQPWDRRSSKIGSGSVSKSSARLLAPSCSTS